MQLSLQGTHTLSSQISLQCLPRGSLDHVIFSKKLLFIIGAIIAATVLIFFSVEQTQIQNNLAASRVALAQNNAIEQTGAELENAKVELESEEQEYVRGD